MAEIASLSMSSSPSFQWLDLLGNMIVFRQFPIIQELILVLRSPFNHESQYTERSYFYFEGLAIRETLQLLNRGASIILERNAKDATSRAPGTAAY